MPLPEPTSQPDGFSELRGLQRCLEDFYGLEPGPDVAEFVYIDESQRETLLVQEHEEELGLALVLPSAHAGNSGDLWAQLVEGVSHFVYVAERARTGLPATQLELELQAEVDKFVLLAMRASTHEARVIHEWLFADARFLHGADTERGARYRMASELAARYMARLFRRPGPERVRAALRQFYRSGQSEKIRLARAD
jgi:hypothetical protein